MNSINRPGGVLAALACVVLFGGADWLQFRGPDATCVAPGEGFPSKLDEKSIAWKVDLPGKGVSSPIVVGDRVVVTAGSGVDQDRLHVLAYSVKTGELDWERTFWATGRTQTHRSIGVAAPSPASDGKRIFAFFSSNDMACLDLEGNLLWYRGIGHDFPNASNSLGMSSSPIVVVDTIVTMVESDAEAFTVGLSVGDGTPKWRIDRPRKANWSSPGVLRTKDATYAIVGGSKGYSAIDPSTGRVAWKWGEGGSTIPSATSADGFVFVPAGGVTALDPKTLKEGAPRAVWEAGQLRPSTASPVVSDGNVYVVAGNGVLTAADALSGEVLWRTRLEGKSGSSATPIVAAGHVYVVDKDGLVHVVRIGDDEGAITGTLALGASIQATPAAANGALFVRGNDTLWKIAN